MRSLLSALCAAAALAALCAPAKAAQSDFGIASAQASLSTAQAGAHPDITTSFEVATDPASEENVFGLKRPYGVTRDIVVSLPPGLLANPNAVPHCSVAQLETWSLEEGKGGGCPNASQVGTVQFYAYLLTQAFTEPLYMMQPPGEDAVARLGFVGGTFPIYIEATLRSDGDYGVDASVLGASGQQEVVKASTTLWGVPAAKAHDRERCTPFEAFKGCTISVPKPPGGEPRDDPEALTINPTRCHVPLALTVAVDSYAGYGAEQSASLGPIGGCDQIEFNPSLALAPTSHLAAEPTGLDADLSMPQTPTKLPPEGEAKTEEEIAKKAEDLAGEGLATSQLRYATVTLPQGMTIASGAGDGLQACSAAEVGLGTTEPSHCPNAAKIATATISSPALSAPVKGAVYQRTPVKGNLFGVWLVADELGVHLKLPGEVHADPESGQLTTLFEGTQATEGLPQAPVESFELRFFSGPRAPLAAPRACGTYYAHYSFVPWSGRPAKEGEVPMSFDQGCDTGHFTPTLQAGSANPLAGAYSPLLTTITLPSGQQNPEGLQVALPPGVLAKLAGVALCEGAAAASGDCPEGSLIGHGTVAAGPGPTPLWLPQPGREPIEAYLSGPYNNAPYSLVVRAPAQAGPFDLGTVVTRAAIHIDPETAHATVISDPLPQILEGVPIAYRTIHVAVDREGFALNPTGCSQKSAAATLTSSEGAVASASAPYRVGGCAALPFKPSLSLSLRGGTRRGAHPALTAVLKARPGDANVARASAALPRTEFLDQAHIRTICTRVQFAADQCPAGAIYGKARAFTPLLDQPLEGPVYLRSSSHELPDMVIALHGAVDFYAVARIDSVNGGIRSTFEAVPDAPVTKVVLEMQGGRKGLLVNSRDICKARPRAEVKLWAHSGARKTLRPALSNRKCGKGK
jgi:hypothetical protein